MELKDPRLYQLFEDSTDGVVLWHHLKHNVNVSYGPTSSKKKKKKKPMVQHCLKIILGIYLNSCNWVMYGTINYSLRLLGRNLSHAHQLGCLISGLRMLKKNKKISGLQVLIYTYVQASRPITINEPSDLRDYKEKKKIN